MPAPRPKNVLAVDLGASPCRTVAASQPAQAARSASSVSLFPGTSTVGVSIAAERLDRLLEPRWTEAKSPAADHDVGVAERSTRIPRAVEVAVKVAEGEQPHGRSALGGDLGDRELGGDHQQVASVATNPTTGQAAGLLIRWVARAAKPIGIPTEARWKAPQRRTGLASREAKISLGRP